MLFKIIFTGICILTAFFGIAALVIAKENADMRKKELKEAKENAQKMAEANEIKENANSGNLNNDIEYMGDILHQLAEKE